MQWYFLFEPNTSIVEQRCFFVLGTSWSPAPVSLMRAKWQTKLFQLNRMINSFHRPDRDIVQKVANATISVCGKGQRWDWSLHLVSAMQSQQGLANGCSLPEPDAVSYGTIISVLGKAVRWQRALLLLHECDARKTEGKLCSDRYRADRAPDLVCYNAAMAACGQGLQWLKAGAVLTAMIEKNIMPDALSISTLLTTFGNATRWQLALWHFFTFSFPPDSSFSCSSSSSAFSSSSSSSSLSPSFSYLPSPPASKVLFGSHCSHHHVHMFHDVVTLSSAISACEKGRQWQAALSLLTQAMTGEICAAATSLPTTPSNPSRSLKLSSLFPDDVSFNAAIVACEGCSQWEFAAHLLTQLSFWSTPAPTCYATTMKAMSAARKWQHALTLLKRLTPSCLSSTVNLFEHRFVDGFGWGSLLTAWHVKPERLSKMLENLVRQVFCFCSGRQALELRRGAEVAEVLCLLNWMQILGVNDSSAISRFLRCKVLGHSSIFACRSRSSVQHHRHLSNLGRFAGDILERQGFRFCAWS